MGVFRVLVVDDDLQIRKAFDLWLRSYGFEPIVVSSRGEAEHVLATRLIHLAIVDVRLHAEDVNDTQGLELCRTMDPLIPRIILTAFAENFDIPRQALRIDPTLPRQRLADAFLVKDVDDPDVQFAEIKRILESEYEIVPKQRIAVLTSGGDAPGMNAALWSIVRTAMQHDVEVIGVSEGYDGLIKNQMRKLRWDSVSDIMTESGTILLSARSRKFRDKEQRKLAVSNVLRKAITGLIVIGGDGSMNGARAFAEDVNEQSGRQLNTVAIPGTIDNDIYGTDMSLGASSAANAMIELVRQMVKPAQALRVVFVVEVMGALSGFLALQAAIGTGADATIIPEDLIVSASDTGSWRETIDVEASKARLDASIEAIHQQFIGSFAAGKKFGFVIQAEGLDKCTRPIIESLAGAEFLDSEYTVRKLKEKFATWPEGDRPEVRLQRLGYTVRGVLPNGFDVWLGATLGQAAVEKLMEGATNAMVGWSEGKGVVTTDFEVAVSMSNVSPAANLKARSALSDLSELQRELTAPLPKLDVGS
jgi:6-phosphofructokinase 1